MQKKSQTPTELEFGIFIPIAIGIGIYLVSQPN